MHWLSNPVLVEAKVQLLPRHAEPSSRLRLVAGALIQHPFNQVTFDRTDLGAFYPMMGHACHVAVVEVDVETGKVEFLKYSAVHDAGVLVNPMTLDGHITGGVAQGLGTAMYEELAYDENGQLLSSSFMDYLIPTAMDVPWIDIDHQETPSPFTDADTSLGANCVNVPVLSFAQVRNLSYGHSAEGSPYVAR